MKNIQLNSGPDFLDKLGFAVKGTLILGSFVLGVLYLVTSSKYVCIAPGKQPNDENVIFRQTFRECKRDYALRKPVVTKGFFDCEEIREYLMLRGYKCEKL